jgi:hypothetical protein
MFAFLIGAIITVAPDHRPERDEWFWRYTAVAVLMIIGILVIPTTRIFHEHTVFALETWEIALFAIYWGFQTAEKWHERPEPALAPPMTAPRSAGPIRTDVSEQVVDPKR